MMMKSKVQKLTLCTFFSFLFISVSANICVGLGVLFEDKFEGNRVDKNKWDVPAVWTVNKGALDANGGNVGITVKDDFTDFELYCDFNMQINLWDAEFVLRAQDKNNGYMFQIVADNRHQFWNHIQVNGQFQIPDKFKIPDESKVNPKTNEWYSVKLVVEGNRFEYYYGRRGEELKKAFTWEDDTYKKGAVGFRQGGGEHCLYDNFAVTTIGGFGVNPHDRLATTWGRIKNGK